VSVPGTGKELRKVKLTFSSFQTLTKVAITSAAFWGIWPPA